MCLIIDANMASSVFDEKTRDDFLPIIEWLTSPKKDGNLVVGGHLAVELDKVAAARRFVRSLQQAGRARFIPQNMADVETERIRNQCESDDPHVIALARISGARILCSRDQALHRDFANTDLISNPGGHIYQTVAHKHLLRRYGHTPACRKSVSERKYL